MMAYSFGYPSSLVFSQLSSADFEQSGGMMPVADVEGQTRGHEISGQLFGRWGLP